MPSPVMPGPCRRKRRQASRAGLWSTCCSSSGASTTSAGCSASTSGITDPWVHPGEKDFSKEVAQNQHDAADQEQGQHKKLILGAKRLQQKLAHAGIVQDDFQQGCPTEEGGELEAQQRNQWINSIAQGMFVDYLALTETLGA